MGDSMSSIVVSGDTSGAITLAAPAVSGTNTITLPASTGTVALTSQLPVSGPAFNVYVSTSSQSIPNATQTTVRFDTKTFDTDNIYSTSTYRVTPTVAGYYQMNFSMGFANNAVGTNYAQLYKNGSTAATFYDLTLTSNFYSLSGSVLVYANGTTDYFYIDVYQAQGSSRLLTNQTIWSGVMVRGA